WEEMPVRAIRDLTPPDEGFRLDARVVRVASRGVAVGTEHRTVFEGLLADGSGVIGFTAWRDFSLREGEAVRIGGSYLRTYRRRPQLVLDDRSIVARLPDDSLPPAAVHWSSSRHSIARCEAEGGGEWVELAGRVVGLLPPSGLLYRCPECRRLTHQGICRTHGPVAGRPDLAARLVLDDGTGAATVNLDRSATESASGLTLDGCLERLRSEPDPSGIEERLW
ncbi:replication factor A, partial [mine drainage metagenome]